MHRSAFMDTHINQTTQQ